MALFGISRLKPSWSREGSAGFSVRKEPTRGGGPKHTHLGTGQEQPPQGRLQPFFHGSSSALLELAPQTGKFSCTSVPQKVCCQPRAPSTALFCLPFAPWIWLTVSPPPLCFAIRAQAPPWVWIHSSVKPQPLWMAQLQRD